MTETLLLKVEDFLLPGGPVCVAVSATKQTPSAPAEEGERKQRANPERPRKLGRGVTHCGMRQRRAPRGR